MTTKSINSIIRKKINHWLLSIKDEKLRERISNDIIVTGGAIVSLLQDEEVNDYDVYFTSKEVAQEAAEYYLGLTGENSDTASVGFPDSWKKQSNHEIDEENRVYLHIPNGTLKIDPSTYEEDSTYNPLFLSNNAITLQGKIQLIFRFIGDADEIHTNYDFVHCTNYWKDGKLNLKEEALTSILTKELKYVGSKYPVSSAIRVRKYVERGYSINAGEFFKILWQIHELDLKDVNVLREQLTGVDIFYFEYMLSQLNSIEGEITTEYVFKAIDEAFSDSSIQEEQ